MSRLFTLLLLWAVALPLWSQTKSVQNISIPAKTRLCPPRAGSGDREFSGHGPKVQATANVSMVGLTKIRLTLTLHAIETKSDWTEARGSWTYDVYTVPSGYKITRIVSSAVSEANYTDSNHSLDRPAVTRGTLVNRFEIMGDTGGNDVGNCTTDDVYMNVYFNTMQVEIQKLETVITTFGTNFDSPTQQVNKISKGLNGLSHDNQFWYFSQAGQLWKVPRSKNLASIGELADEDMVQAEIPPYLARNGYDSFGDLDYYQGMLWVALQGSGRAAGRPLLAVFRADNMELVTTITMRQWQTTISCVAINPATGYLFSAVTGSTSFLNQYRIIINGDQVSLAAPLRFNLTDKSDRAATLVHIQCGAFSANGRYLFLSEERKTSNHLRAYNHRNGKEMYTANYSTTPAAQGVTFWATGSAAPGISGNLHLLLLHPNAGDRDAYTFRHYTIQEGLDWNG